MLWRLPSLVQHGTGELPIPCCFRPVFTKEKSGWRGVHRLLRCAGNMALHTPKKAFVHTKCAPPQRAFGAHMVPGKGIGGSGGDLPPSLGKRTRYFRSQLVEAGRLTILLPPIELLFSLECGIVAFIPLSPRLGLIDPCVEIETRISAIISRHYQVYASRSRGEALIPLWVHFPVLPSPAQPQKIIL